jgi:hypothetical protein
VWQHGIRSEWAADWLLWEDLSLIDLNDVCSLTEFHRKSRVHLRRLQETGRPQVLTVNGRAALVVQSAAAYQQLLDRLAGRVQDDPPAPLPSPTAAADTPDADLQRGQP